MDTPWHQYLFGIVFILAGINHFRVPRMYEKIIPPYFENKKLWNNLSGLGEIILGIGLLIPQTSIFSAWGLVLLLIGVFPANWYMYQNDKVSFGLSKTIRLIRLPIQVLLILWALYYTNIF